MLTVFTPTYNRGEKLKRLYSSLLDQCNSDFEWLIVDDGSTDDTEAIVNTFFTSEFPIRYYRKENGGKHTAYNYALKVAKGDYFVCIDSDDWLSKEAISNILEVCTETNTNILMAYKSDVNGNLLSNNFPETVTKAGILELSNFYRCTGEFTLVFQTEFARKFPFPVFDGEKFVTESVIYDKMFENEKALLLSEVVTICEYQNDGLTNNLNEIMKKNPAGYCLYFMQRIDAEFSIKKKILAVGKYYCFSKLAKEKKCRYNGKYKMFVRLLVPFGWGVYIYYKMVRGL